MDGSLRDKRDKYFPPVGAAPMLGKGYAGELLPEQFSPDPDQMRLKSVKAGKAAVVVVNLREKFIQENDSSFNHMGG